MNRDIKNGNTGNIKNEWQEETMAVNFNESETKDNLMRALQGKVRQEIVIHLQPLLLKRPIFM